jgi:hypothetical protein
VDREAERGGTCDHRNAEQPPSQLPLPGLLDESLELVLRRAFGGAII